MIGRGAHGPIHIDGIIKHPILINFAPITLELFFTNRTGFSELGWVGRSRNFSFE